MKFVEWGDCLATFEQIIDIKYINHIWYLVSALCLVREGRYKVHVNDGAIFGPHWIKCSQQNFNAADILQQNDFTFAPLLTDALIVLVVVSHCLSECLCSSPRLGDPVQSQPVRVWTLIISISDRNIEQQTLSLGAARPRTLKALKLQTGSWNVF